MRNMTNNSQIMPNIFLGGKKAMKKQKIMMSEGPLVLCLLLRLKSLIARGTSHHPAFMSSCPTITHTFSALSTK